VTYGLEQADGLAGRRRASVAVIGTRGYPSFYGGFETAVRYLAPYLADAGWAVTVYGRPGATMGAPDPRVTARTTRGFETKSLSTLSFGFSASLDAARRRPDVALVMNVANGYFLPLLKARGIPTLVNVDGIEWERAKWGRRAQAVFRQGAALTAKYATEIVCDAEAIQRRWASDFGRTGRFIPYGGERPAREVELPFGLERRRFALVVARFVPENSVSVFFDAVERLAGQVPVVIVGSSGYGGVLDDRARRLAETYPDVHWLGHVKDDQLLHTLWSQSGAYFHGHTVGGTNPALVQAMACGAPIIAVDTEYNAEVLRDPSCLVPRDPQVVAERIRQLLADPERQELYSQANLERSSSVYTWEKVCAGYEAALRELMRNSGKTRGAGSEDT
jgi:glycosyltransferase involved in cell wall biosynthesis